MINYDFTILLRHLGTFAEKKKSKNLNLFKHINYHKILIYSQSHFSLIIKFICPSLYSEALPFEMVFKTETSGVQNSM